MPQPADGRLTFLDGWRALAVAIVIASHVTGFRHEPLFLKQWARWLPAGEVGVLVFFFISGFVISRAALAEIERTGTFSQTAFYIRRGFRIIPPLLLYLAVCLVLGGFGLVAFTWRNALPAALYVCNIDPFNNCIWLGGQTWSLAFEEQFYLFFPIPLGLFLLGRKPNALHLAGATVFCLLPLVFPLSYSSRLEFVRVYGLFAMGFLAARHYDRLVPVARRHAGGLTLLAAILVFVVTPFTLPVPVLADDYPLSFILTIPVMVFCAAFSPAAPVLNLAVLRYLGRISYGIYLWQELATSDLFRHRPLGVELAAIAGIVLLCALLFEGMEKPLIAFGRRFAATRSGEPAPTAAALSAQPPPP